MVLALISSLLGWATDGYCDSSGYLPGYTTPGYGLNFLCEEYNYDDGMCDIYQDCAGAYFGSAAVDCAGDCNGSAVEDYCGVCNGTNVANECEEAPNPCLVAGGVLVNMFDSYGELQCVSSSLGINLIILMDGVMMVLYRPNGCLIVSGDR